MEKWRTARGQFLIALIIASLASIGLYAYGVLRNHNLAAAYLLWNLVLAWVPLLLAIRLMSVLGRKAWSSWEGLATSFLWLAFLPNSFYLVSDFIHLQDLNPVNVLYDTVIFTSFIVTGLVLGLSSLYLVHWQLRRRLGSRRSAAWVGVVLLFCSIAIYMGRDLRWNTWDIFVNPGGLLFEAADRIQHPASYPHMLLIIGAFFVMLTVVYNLVWRGTRLFTERTRA